MIINDLYMLESPFKVYDTRSHSVIYTRIADEDVPIDIAFLPVIRIYAVDDLIYIDTEA